MTSDTRSHMARIRTRFGTMISDSAIAYGHRPEVLAGIMMRETEGGESKWLIDESHTPENKADDTGDSGHGHGLMQIDDRSFADFCRSDEWKDPAKNIAFAARVLQGKRLFLSRAGVPDSVIEKASIAAYNCGEGNVLKSYRAGEDLDAHTADHNYSRCVLEFAAVYKEVLQVEQPPAPVPDPSAPDESTSGGFFGLIWRIILKIFVGKKAVTNGKDSGSV